MESSRWRLAVSVVSVLALSAVPGAARQGTDRFTEEAVERGLVYSTFAGIGIAGSGCGLALVDLDGDGDQDVVLTGRPDDQPGLFENDGTGYFADRKPGSGLPALPLSTGVVCFDYDGDGRLDVFAAQGDGADMLARGIGPFQFQDVSSETGVADDGPGTGPTVADYDLDGWLDLYVSNYEMPNRLYRNRGNGTFGDIAPDLGVDDPSRTFQAAFFDMDLDGDADLYVSNDKKLGSSPMHNILYRNDGGTFTDVSFASGTAVNIYSMGIAVGDFDGNGYPDLYCTNKGWEANALLLNQDGSSFLRAEASAGVDSFVTSWGAFFADYDNDTHNDLYVCNFLAPNLLFDYGGAWPALDMAEEAGVAVPLLSYCVAVGDVNDDGNVDFLLQNNDENVRLFVNRGGDTNWIKFDLVGSGTNRMAVGAVVEIRVGPALRRREVLVGGNGFLSQNTAQVHFGLGAATAVNEVDVIWPAGERVAYGSLSANRTWTLRRPVGVTAEVQDRVPR